MLSQKVIHLLKVLYLDRIFSVISNVYCLFGFLWGLLIPLLVLALHFWFNKRPFNIDSCLPVFEEHPIYWIFLLHPLLFAAAFGVVGAILQSREKEIQTLIHRLEAESATDPLTGLLNRRRLTRILAREIKQATSLSTPLSIGLLDIDRFKKINDTYGHLAGDHVLCGIAQTLERGLRPYDFVGRWGGEEFIVVLPNTTPSQAYIVAERMRLAVAAQSHTFDGNILQVTISIGIAVLTTEDDFDRFIDKADTALYKAKEQGKNCTQIFS